MSGTIGGVTLTQKVQITQYSAADLAVGGFADLQILQDWSANLANGTGASQASQVYQDNGSLGASASTNIDLAGSLTNAFGATITFTKIKLLAIRASTANNVANNLQVTRPAANGFVWFLAASDGFYLAPGATFIWFDPAGVAVTAGTGDILTLTNGAGSNTITYDLIIVGVD
jgi:hypothetical protein